MKAAVFRPSGSAVYYVKFRHEGKQVLRSTGIAEHDAACRRASEIVREFTEPSAELLIPASEAQGPKIGDIVALYLRLESPSQSTKEQNVRDLLRIIHARFPGSREELMQLPTGIINELTIHAFLRARQGGRIRKDRVLACNASINSFLNHAKGVFSRKAVEMYERAGLWLPDAIADLRGFPALPVHRKPPARIFRGVNGTLRVWIDEHGAVCWQADGFDVDVNDQ